MGYNHSTRRVWECSGRLKTNHLDGSARCTLPRFDAATLDKQLDSETSRIFNDPQLFREHLTRTMENLKQERDELERKLKPIQADIQHVENSMSIADTKLEAGRLDKGTYKAIIAGLRSKLRDLEHRQERADPMMLMDIKTKDRLVEFCEDVLKVVNKQPIDARPVLMEVFSGLLTLTSKNNAKLMHQEIAPVLLTETPNAHNTLRQFSSAIEVYPDHIEVKTLLGKRQSTTSLAYST